MRRVALLVALVTPAAAHEVDTGRLEAIPRRESAMVLVPGGTFSMGLDTHEMPSVYRACVDEIGLKHTDQMPELCARILTIESEYTGEHGRQVYVSPFWIDRYEVTTGDYRGCVEAGLCDLTPLVSGDTRYLRDDLPVVNVTWFDASRYCAAQHKRLPTEAEWEKAARGDDGRRFPWGNADGDDRANLGQVEPEVLRPTPQQLAQAQGFFMPSTTSDKDGVVGLAPPGSYRWGRSPYGLYDMAGNAAEWVADWFTANPYAGQSLIDPTGPPSGMNNWRVVRGGSFIDPRFYARTYHRRFQRDTVRSIGVGFRCAKDVR